MEVRLKDSVEINKQQYGLCQKVDYRCHVYLKTVDEKVQGSSNRATLCIRGPRKAYDRASREKLWYCMKKSGMAEKYVQLVQDIYEGSKTVVRCAIGTTESFMVKVGLHQGSRLAVSAFLCTVMMDRITDNANREPPWTMLIADDIAICEETRKEVERRLK